MPADPVETPLPPVDASDGADPGRIVALTDGVTAIAMTLLALDLRPDGPALASSGALAHYLHTHLGQYLAFAIAFTLIAQYWVTHHRIMRAVRVVTPRLLAETMLFLFAITLVPLCAYLTGTSYGNSLSNFIFAADIFLISAALGLLSETIHRARLDGRQEDHLDRVWRRWRSVTSLAIPALVGGVAWVWTGQVGLLYLLFFLADYPGRLATGRLRSS